MKRLSIIFITVLLVLFVFSGCNSGGKLEYENQKKINLWENEEDIPYLDSSVDQPLTNITPYIAEENEDGKAVIIIPGGGYAIHADMETEIEIANELNSNNISAFILDYRIAPYDKDAIMSDGFRAVRFVRYYAESFGIDPEKIAVLGMSAGGHLAIMTMEHFDDELEVCGDKIDKVSARPNAGILCYPVGSFKEGLTHEKSRANFLGEANQYDEAMQDMYSAELGVTEDTPPAFIWHTKKDKAVPYESSELLAKAFEEQGIECEFQLYPYGSHGLGLAKGIEEVEEWFGDCMEWLDKIL